MVKREKRKETKEREKKKRAREIERETGGQIERAGSRRG